MKSILVGPKEKKQARSTYPYLGICEDNGLVVLFSSHAIGAVIHDPSKTYTVGDHQRIWAEDCFVRLEGKVTLSN